MAGNWVEPCWERGERGVEGAVLMLVGSTDRRRGEAGGRLIPGMIAERSWRICAYTKEGREGVSKHSTADMQACRVLL
jgi:hypothetical protein